MLKIAFIGCSYSAYRQDGQYENHWSWKLAQQFPQHQYYSYALGGRGMDHHQWCLLDAKQRGIDVVFINRTYNHRVAQLFSDEDPTFNIEPSKAPNYVCLTQPNHMWLSGCSGKLNIMGKNQSHPLANAIKLSLQDKSISEQNQQYNDRWFDSVDQLYNFKHIIKLELLPIIPNDNENSAQHKLNKAYDIQRRKFLSGKSLNECLIEKGLVHSPTDDHWSPKANNWVLENFILSKETIDILNNS